MLHNLRPGQPYPRFRNGDELRLAPGVYTVPLKLVGLRKVRVSGAVDGGTILDGSSGAAGLSGVRLMDCAEVSLAHLTLRGWRHTAKRVGGHGLFATDCRGLELDELTCSRNAGSGVLTGKCSTVHARELTCNDNGGHGVYFSAGGTDLHLRNSNCLRNQRAGVQINGAPGRFLRVGVVGCALWDNANVGIQLAAVTGAEIAANSIRSAKSDIVVWDDQGGRRYACHDVDLTRQEGAVSVVGLGHSGVKLRAVA